MIGGTLLVACFRNGKLQLQIVGIAVVSGENQDNWDFFLRFLMSNLDTRPRFLISDRDKGLIPAVAALDTIKIHFFCFRHLMENSNRQFKSKPLKNAAWALALTVSESEFAKKAAILKHMNSEAEARLMDVGKGQVVTMLQSMSSIWHVDLKQCRVCEWRAEENPEASHSRLSYGYQVLFWEQVDLEQLKLVELGNADSSRYCMNGKSTCAQYKYPSLPIF